MCICIGTCIIKLIRIKRQFKSTLNSQKLKFRQISYTLNIIRLQYMVRPFKSLLITKWFIIVQTIIKKNLAAVIWPKYCRYGVYGVINQSKRICTGSSTLFQAFYNGASTFFNVQKWKWIIALQIKHPNDSSIMVVFCICLTVRCAIGICDEYMPSATLSEIPVTPCV